jgi:protein-S-isoprenylcysteine O-methyltransferase Ste14
VPFSAFIFWWARKIFKAKNPSFAFSSNNPKNIILIGPYKYVRHPFYLSYTLAWIAGSLATSLWLLLTFVAMLIIYYLSAK